MNKSFLEFLIEGETPPKALDALIQKDILLSFRAQSIIKKFLGYQVIGTMISLLFCPQFSLGLIENHGVIAVIRVVGDLACACFCGSLFMSAGVVTAILGMKGEELWWLWRRYQLRLSLVPAGFWGVLVTLNAIFKLPNAKIEYHLTWLFAAVTVQASWLLVRKIFAQQIIIKKIPLKG